MRYVNMHYAKTHLSKLFKLALQGEEIIVCSYNKPLMRLVPFKAMEEDRNAPGKEKQGVIG